jgi:hypothetical protein
MRLYKIQIEHLLSMISEGLKTDEINKRAEAFDPTYQVTRSQVEGYRTRRAIDIDAIRKAGEIKGLTEGLANKEARVALLKKLADKMAKELLEEPEKKEGSRWWLHNIKGIGQAGNFKEIEYFEFNAAEVQQLRGVLDDIAAETSGRIQKRELSGPGGGPIPDEGELPDLSGLSDEEFIQFQELFQKTRPGN